MADVQHPAEFDTYNATTTDGLGCKVDMRVYEPSEEPTTKEPTVIAPGWATDSNTMHGAARFLARRGHRVVTFNHVRTNGNDPTGRKTGTLGSVVCAAADFFDSSKVRVEAYSEGFMHAIKLAAQGGIPISSILAANCFGLAPTTVDGLARRVYNEVRSARPSAALAKAAFFGAHYVLDDIALALREVFSVGPTDILPEVEAVLTKRRVPVTVGFGDRDNVSPKVQSEANLATHNLPVTVVQLPGDVGHFHFLFDRRVHVALHSAQPASPKKVKSKKAA